MCTPQEGSMHLRKIVKHFLSSDVLTPGHLPRSTQPNVDLHLVYDDRNYIPHPADHMPEAIVEKHANNNKQFWCPPPGKVAWETFNLHRKHSVDLGPKNTQHSKNQTFPRSYLYELECIKKERINKGYRKLLEMQEIPCQKPKIRQPEPEEAPKSWTKNLEGWPIEFSPEERRKRLSKWMQPFESEAMSWYSEHYPPPTLKPVKNTKYLDI